VVAVPAVDVPAVQIPPAHGNAVPAVAVPAVQISPAHVEERSLAEQFQELEQPRDDGLLAKLEFEEKGNAVGRSAEEIV
jgi:hypothetical protein